MSIAGTLRQRPAVARDPAATPPGLRVLWVVLGTAAAAAVVAFAVLAVRRAAYPYQIEWLEGGAVEHVRRILQGRALYPAPSVDFVAYPYPPLYFLLSAGVAFLTGVGYLPLRIVSIIASFDGSVSGPPPEKLITCMPSRTADSNASTISGVFASCPIGVGIVNTR